MGPPSPDVISEHGKRPLRLSLVDGRQIEIEHAYLQGDSLRGDTSVGRKSDHRHRAVAVALTDIRSIEADEPDKGKTILLIAVVGAVFFGFFALDALAGGDYGL